MLIETCEDRDTREEGLLERRLERRGGRHPCAPDRALRRRSGLRGSASCRSLTRAPTAASVPELRQLWGGR